jgi:hypothetical protein
MVGLLAPPPVRRPSHPDGSEKWRLQAEQVLRIAEQGYSGGSAPVSHRFPSWARWGTIEAVAEFAPRYPANPVPSQAKICAAGKLPATGRPHGCKCLNSCVAKPVEVVYRDGLVSIRGPRADTRQVKFRSYGGRYSGICRCRNPQRVRKNHGDIRIDGRSGRPRYAGDTV